MANLTEYEIRVRDELAEWPTPHRPRAISRIINYPLNKSADLVLKVPQVRAAILAASRGILGWLNDASCWMALRMNGSYEESGEVADLEELDKRAQWLMPKYVGLAVSEGAVTGATGLAGLCADIPLLLMINLYATAHHALIYGSNLNDPNEREFVLRLLGADNAELGLEQVGKTGTLIDLMLVAAEAASKKTWKQLEVHVTAHAARDVAEKLGIRLTKEKLGQVVPVAGAVVAGGTNARFTHEKCLNAYNMYRKRFLMKKHPDLAMAWAKTYRKDSVDDLPQHDESRH